MFIGNPPKVKRTQRIWTVFWVEMMWAVGAVLGLRLREMSLRACVLRIAIIYTSFSEVPRPPPQQTLSVLEAYITPALLLRFAKIDVFWQPTTPQAFSHPVPTPL